MAMHSGLKHNSLKINNLSPLIDGGKENDFTYSRHLSKLLWRFVRLAVPDLEQVTFSDRELLDDLLLFGSLKKIASVHSVSQATLAHRLDAIFERIDHTVDRWEQIAQSDQTARISQLEQELSAANAQLQEKVSKLAAHNRKQAVEQARESQRNELHWRMNSRGDRKHRFLA